MPAYTFEALTADGQTRKGVMQADSARAARGLLRAQALVPVLVDVVGAGGQVQAGAGAPSLLNKSIFAKRAFNTTGLAIWTRQIAGLVSSGLPLERALSSLSDEAQDEAQRNLFLLRPSARLAEGCHLPRCDIGRSRSQARSVLAGVPRR